MEGKCRQMTLSEVLAAEEQQGPGQRVTLLSPSSLLAAKHGLETQYSIFSPHRPRGDNSEPMNSHQCNEFHLPRNGTTAGAAQLLLILPPSLGDERGHSPGFPGHDLGCDECSLSSATLLGHRDDAVTPLPCSLPREPEDPSSTIQTGSPRF